MSPLVRLALLISGGGTTAVSIIRACRNGMLPGVEPVCVIASADGINGIERTAEAGVPRTDIVVCNPQAHASPQEFGQVILAEFDKRGVNYFGQYGWMPQTPTNVIERFPGRKSNQHPGPLNPGFPGFGGRGMHGIRVHCAVLQFARKIERLFSTEAVVQDVDEDFDRGLLYDTAAVEIQPDDTPETLQARVLPVEHQLQIAHFAKVARGEAQLRHRTERLIHDGEEELLKEAKRDARRLYP